MLLMVACWIDDIIFRLCDKSIWKYIHGKNEENNQTKKKYIVVRKILVTVVVLAVIVRTISTISSNIILHLQSTGN